MRGNKLNFKAGRPKVCVPLLVSDVETLYTKLSVLKRLPIDLIEWRLDGLSVTPDTDQLKQILVELRDHIGDMPILLTYRTVSEGGQGDATPELYRNLLLTAIESGVIDLVDMELTMFERNTREMEALLNCAKSCGVKTIISKHDFLMTPEEAVIKSWIDQMRVLDADVVKLAVMATSKSDAVRLMQFAVSERQVTEDVPLILISMGKYGVVSRIMAEFMGSSITFASLGETTAPGQFEAVQAVELLDLIHEISRF